MVTSENLHESFVRQLPELELTALSRFRNRNPEARQEAIQNTRALAWMCWVRLVQRRRAVDDGLLRSVWWYAVRQTKMGRTINRGDGMEGKRRQDAYDQRSKPIQHIDFNYYIGAMTPVPDAVAFRLDLPRFFETLNDRQRAMAMDLASGMTTKEVAGKHGVSAAAVSQFRSRFKVLLERFYEAA
jgi:hypothetical protein